ncbi:MAG TPA: maleylpyruvate isomerase N-terminal domain-containing protein [Pyrinomonadaceae bacterium]|nr:maleylpyruvate isomerase N-terminal domain-containing protein [Pyrinomonadaceae bacterium]
MKRDELLAQVHASHAKLTAALDGLTDEQATRTGLNPQWSVKDALAHITAWELEGAEAIRQLQQGTYERKPFNQETIDRFNAEAVESRRGLTMPEARREFDEAHAAFVRLLESLPEEVEERSPIYKFTEGVAIHHHAHHAAQIEDWKKNLSDG